MRDHSLMPTKTKPAKLYRVGPAKLYRVGTFVDPDIRPTGKAQIRAYLRDYHPSWRGCVEYEILACSGKDAKHLAIYNRLHDERKLAEAEQAIEAGDYRVFCHTADSLARQDLTEDLRKLLREVGALKVRVQQLEARLTSDGSF